MLHTMSVSQEIHVSPQDTKNDFSAVKVDLGSLYGAAIDLLYHGGLTTAGQGPELHAPGESGLWDGAGEYSDGLGIQ